MVFVRLDRHLCCVRGRVPRISVGGICRGAHNTSISQRFECSAIASSTTAFPVFAIPATLVKSVVYQHFCFSHCSWHCLSSVCFFQYCVFQYCVFQHCFHEYREHEHHEHVHRGVAASMHDLSRTIAHRARRDHGVWSYLSSSVHSSLAESPQHLSQLLHGPNLRRVISQS